MTVESGDLKWCRPVGEDRRSIVDGRGAGMILDLKISIPDPEDKKGLVSYLKYVQNSAMMGELNLLWFINFSDLEDAKILSVKEGRPI